MTCPPRSKLRLLPPIERFWARVDQSGGPDACWPWMAGKIEGYGQVRWNGRGERAHRVAWALAKGPIPPGRWVVHDCDNPPCCNWRHLVLGDAKSNAADMAAKGRSNNQRKTHCSAGHLLGGANAYSPPGYPSRRMCVACLKDRKRRNPWRRRSAA